MEIVNIEDEVTIPATLHPPTRLPPIVPRNSVAPTDTEAPIPEVNNTVQAPWYKKPLYLVLPIVSIALVIIVIVVVGSVTNWGRPKTATTTTTSKPPRTSTVLTIVTSPGSTTTNQITTEVGTTTNANSTSAMETTTNANSNSTEETTTNTNSTSTEETTTNANSTSTEETTTNANSTTTEETTTNANSTSTEETTTNPTSTSVAHTFVLSINEQFTAELLDPADFPYHLLSRDTSANISDLFNQSNGYQGCAIESLREGSIEVSLSLLFLYPPMTNLTVMQEEVTNTLGTALPDASEDNVTLTDTCIDCADIPDLKALIEIQTTDYCGAGNNCTSNGTCVNGLDRYFCLCNPGHYGTYCEELTSECDSQLCNSNGQCASEMSGDLFCECVSTYEGDNCTIPVENATYPCDNVTAACSGHGNCFDLSETDYICICDAGYNGTDCEEDIDDCYSSPCFHGNCTDAVNSFVCDCEPGYDGKQCQINVDECLAMPCGLNSTCYDLVNGYVCACEAGYTGSDCHSICDDFPCFNNGTCSLCPNGYCEDTKLSFSCNCPSDIYGLLCTNEKYPGFSNNGTGSG